MKLYYFSEMPHHEFPDEEGDKYPSLRLEFPNRFFDREKAAANYQRYLTEYEFADQAGFDGLMINEHHSTPSCVNVGVNMTAAVLARTTRRGEDLAARQNPPIQGEPPGVGRPPRLHLRAVPGAVRDRARAVRVLSPGRRRGRPDRDRRQPRLSHLRRHGGDQGEGHRGRTALRLAHGADAARADRVLRAGGDALAGGDAVRAARAAAVAGDDELPGAAGRSVHRRRHARRGDRPVHARPARAGGRPPPPGGSGVAHGPPDDDALDRADGREGHPGGGGAVAAQPRLPSKNSLSRAPHSAPSTPPCASTRWFRRPSSSSRCRDSIAPAFGSGAPYTTRATRA